ncbi:MAG TPA: ABC transporter permease [Pseudonocardiaceae bacterium]
MTAAVAVAGAIPESQPTWLGTNVFTQIRVLTLRALKTVVRDPRIIVFSVIQPLVMLALFSQIFSSIAQTPGFPAGVSYIAYLMPAILVNTAMGSAMQSGVGLVNDMRNGVLARFRSLPIAHGSVLAARSLSDLVRTAFQLLITLVFGILVFGFWPAGGIVGLLGALLLGLLLSWALGWVFLAAGAWLRNAEVMQMVGFLLMFPLMFASSSYVPVANLPAWLQAVAQVNPITHAVNAARALTLATPVGNGVIATLAISAVLAVVGSVLAVRGFRRPL